MYNRALSDNFASFNLGRTKSQSDKITPESHESHPEQLIRLQK